MAKKKPPLIEFREPTPFDITHISAHIRMADAREIYNATGKPPLPVIRQAVANSRHSFVAAVNGVPMVIWGLVVWSDVTGRGSPWAFTCVGVERYKRQFMKYSKAFVAMAQEQCPVLLEVNVDAEYVAALRWLEWLGFDVSKKIGHGPENRPFRVARRSMGSATQPVEYRREAVNV